MTCTHAHAHPREQFKDRRIVSDPTRTGPIVNSWRLDARVRMRRVEKRVRNLITMAEGVGLTPIHFRLLFDKEFVGNTDSPWFQKYIEKTYQHGVTTASKKLHQDAPPKLAETDLNVIDFLVGRATDAFAVVGNEMANQISVAVHDAPDVQYAIKKAIDRLQVIGEQRVGLVISYMVVSTHSDATLNLFRSRGVTKVGVIPEGIPVLPVKDDRHARRGPGGRFASTETLLATFTTAGDAKVCPQCQALEGKIYDIDSAYGVIPVHPNCRCDWTPDEDNQEAWDVPIDEGN